MTKPDLSFPRKEKLKSKKLLEQLFAQPEKTTAFPVKLFYIKTDELPEDVRAQVAVAVPKRNFKRAVHRNRIKRLLREAYRHQKPELFNNIQGNYAFLFLYLGKEMPTHKIVEQAVAKVLQKLKDAQS